jgi:redox-sensing transcriptional repressor
MNKSITSVKSIGRLSLYRRLLNTLAADNITNVFSHELAAMAKVTAAQVRRDLMATGYSGSPIHGYEVKELIKSIGNFLDSPKPEGVILIGVGNLGRAILAYFAGRRPKLSIVAAFDSDSSKVNRVIQGCRCHPLREMADFIRENSIKVAIITVPAGEAQNVANELVHAGIKGILNFAPVRLHVPEGIYVEDNDITMSLEKVAYFSCKEQ